ncbi:MAG: hypothetical protein ACFE0I_17215 [Elainellaceae cyanobacterium]
MGRSEPWRNPTQSDFNGIVGFPYVNHNLQVLVISEDVSGNQGCAYLLAEGGVKRLKS